MSIYYSNEKYDPTFNYPEHANADKKNGTRMTTEKSFASIAAEFMYKIGTKILSGNLSIMSIQPPSTVLHDHNHLELLQDAVVMMKNYIHVATEMKDPLERQKCIAVGFLANNYICDTESGGQIPIPCFKNEYLEGHTSDGSYVISRCLTKDPLVNTIRLVGPDASFTYDSTQELKVEPASMTFSVFRCRRFTTESSLVLKDGTEYQIEYPSFDVEDAVSSDKNLKYINITTEDSWIWDKTNGYKALFEFPQPASGGLFGMFKEDPKSTVHQKNIVNIRIIKVDAEGKSLSQTCLASGFGNLLSFIQLEGTVHWKINDLCERWQYDKPGYNHLPHSTLNRKYINMIREGNFREADIELEKIDNEVDLCEPFMRRFAPGFDIEQIIDCRGSKRETQEISNLVNEIREPQSAELKKSSNESKIRTNSPKKEEEKQFEIPSLKFHQEEVKFVFANGKKKLKSQVIVENFGNNNIVLKTKSNAQSRYAVRPIVTLLMPNTKVNIEVLAQAQNLSDVPNINDKFLFSYSDVGTQVLKDDYLKNFFKNSEVKFLHAKMPIIFYDESGEVINRSRSTMPQSSNTEKNFTSNVAYKSPMKSHYVNEVIAEDPREFRKESRNENPKTGMQSTDLDSSAKNEESEMEVKKLKQELDKVNARARYLQNQVSSNGPTKKKVGYQLWHVVGALVFGMYIGNLFLAKSLI